MPRGSAAITQKLRERSSHDGAPLWANEDKSRRRYVCVQTADGKDGPASSRGPLVAHGGMPYPARGAGLHDRRKPHGLVALSLPREACAIRLPARKRSSQRHQRATRHDPRMIAGGVVFEQAIADDGGMRPAQIDPAAGR